MALPLTPARPTRSRRVAGHQVSLPDDEVRTHPISVAARYRCGASGELWWWSPELYVLHGLRPGEHEPCAELMLQQTHPQDRSRVQSALGAALTRGTPFAIEHRLVRQDGSTRTVVLFGEPEPAPDGGVAGVTGLVIDVTDGRPAAGADAQLHTLETEVEQLRTAMASRAAIEQAKGVLMLLMGCGDQVAFDLLAHISSHTHRKVRDVAGAIVASASGRTPLPADVKEILHDACPPGQAPA